MTTYRPAEDSRFRRVPRERIADRVAQELLRLVAEGELAPGERLPGERQLAEMMSVSRVSVRAALQQLKARGLVSSVQGGGTRIEAAGDELVSGLCSLVKAKLGNLHDLAEIRKTLEVWAARRAAARATPEQLAQIEEALAVMAEPGRSRHHTAEDDHRFHLAIAKASGSAVYMHLMTVLGDILEEMFAFHRHHLYPTEEDDRIFARQHGAIAQAIAAGAEDEAAAAMARHLSTVLARYVEEGD